MYVTATLTWNDADACAPAPTGCGARAGTACEPTCPDLASFEAEQATRAERSYLGDR